MDQQDDHEQSQLPIDFNGSLDPSHLPNVTLGNHSLMASHRQPYSPMTLKHNGTGRTSPVKTIKEYDQQVSDLTKENFNLKLRIYHMEERMWQQYGSEQDVFKTNIELKVRVDHLEEELAEKQIYLQKAAQAVSTMTVNHQQAEESIRQQCVADRQKEVDALKEQLDKAIHDCEESRELSEGATKELEKMEDGLRLAHKDNEELSKKMITAQSEIGLLERKLKDSDDLVQELKDIVSGLEKRVERKDRDVQDKYEDQLEEVEKLKRKNLDLDAQLKLKNNQLEGVQKELEDKVKEVDDKAVTIGKCQQTVGALMNKLYKMNITDGEKDKKIKTLESKVSELEKTLDTMTKEKNQGLTQTLGKKQGEMFGFQEQLTKAMEALTCSENAVEELQMQLKKERTEFENQLRHQAILFEEKDCANQDSDEEIATMRQQLNALKKSLAEQNVVMAGHQRDLSNLEKQNKKLTSKEKDLMDEKEDAERRLLTLEREIHSLRLELERKNKRIGSLQKDCYQMERPSVEVNWQDINVQILPQNVMEDLGRLVESLRQELLNVKVLQNTLQNLQSKGTSGMSDSLQCEIHKIYSQLEEGVAKTSQLHQYVLDSLRGNEPPEFFKDAGTTPRQPQISSLPHATTPSPRSSGNKDDLTAGLAQPSGNLLANQSSFRKDSYELKLSDLTPPENLVATPQGGMSRPTNVKDTDSLLDHTIADISIMDHSLTDDAKEGNLRFSTDSPSSHNPLQFFEPRMQDRASLYRPDSQEDGSRHHSVHETSREFGVNPGQGQGATVNLIDLFTEPVSPHSPFTGKENVADESGNHPSMNKQNTSSSNSTVAGRTSGDLNFSHPNITQRSLDFTKSFVNVTLRNSDNFAPSQDTSLSDPDIVKSTNVGRRSEDGLDGKDNSPRKKMLDDATDAVGRRSSWADELAQYRITNDEQTQTSPGKDSIHHIHSGQTSSSLSSSQRQQLEEQHQQAISSMTAAEQRKLMEQLQMDLREALRLKEEAHSQVDELQNKLEATENTVRQLSRKMKTYQSTLEKAGINPSMTRRSSSEASLERVGGQPQIWGSVQGGGDDDHDAGGRVTLSSSLDRCSMERGRDESMSHPRGRSAFSPSLIMPSSHSLSAKMSTSTMHSDGTTNPSPDRFSNVDTLFDNESRLTVPSFISNTATDAANSSQSRLENLYTNQNTPRSSTRKFSADSPETLQQNNGARNAKLPGQQDKELSGNSSVLNATGVDWGNSTQEKEDPTMTSMLVTDYSYLHKRLSILSETIFPRRTNDQSFNNTTIDVEKLQARLAHLERIILMQKEEITVYESLMASLGHPVLSSTDKQANDSSSGGVTNDSLLRQHLVEIRRLRQRLENLDLGNDPDQLLIFHTHTQQRISHQERIISQLQQKLVEKEEVWHRQTMETEHRFGREKVLLSQKLENAQDEIKNQRLRLEDQENAIEDLKESLQHKDEEREEEQKENERLKQEKAEIEEDLVKREKSFLDVEKTMFKLELAKEETDCQKSLLQAELGQREKQVVKLKDDMEHLKENGKHLRDLVRSKEDALLEHVERLKKMAQEKAEVDEKLSQLQNELEDVRADAERMKKEAEEKMALEKELSDLRSSYDLKTRSHMKIVRLKSDLETQVAGLEEEKSKTEQTIFDLRQEIETCGKTRQGLEEELSNLRAMLEKRRNMESELRSRVNDLDAALKKEEEERLTAEEALKKEDEERSKAEEALKKEGEERSKIEEELKEKTEKVKKRDRQCQFVLDRFGKLEAAYKKSRKLLQDQTDALSTTNKQLQFYQSTLTSLSKDKDQDTMKELFHELMLTKKQVADLLTRLEDSSSHLHTKSDVLMDTTSSKMTSITTETMTLKTITDSINTTSTTTELFSNIHTGLEGDLIGAQSNPVMVLKNYEPNSLFAVLQLDQHEKAGKETGECLVSLSGLEARVQDRLKAYKTKTVTERMRSLDYSTLRQAGIACHEMRTCLTEVSRIISHAVIRELPATHSSQQEVDELKSELTQLQSRCSELDQTVKAFKKREKVWEHSVCRQLVKTSQDLEQAKENIDLSRGILQQVNTSAKANAVSSNTDVDGKMGVMTSNTSNARVSFQADTE